MIPRFKLIAAALGVVVATSAIGDASAMTVVKTARTHSVAGAKVTKVITHRPHHVVVGGRIVKHVRIVHRAPILVRKVVRVTTRPVLHRSIVAHRVVTKTIIR